MSDWPATIWTEAGQITALLGWPPQPDERAPPPRFFEALRAAGRDRDAIRFLAQALPRFEAVAWAARMVASQGRAPDPALLAAVTAWLRDPSEAHRRAAGAVAAARPAASPARLCAFAAFTAGGSLAPDGAPPFAAPRATAGRFVAGAVLAAAAEQADPPAARAAALDAGLLLARQGHQP
ncbi:DUF6931 family protein [Sphingomonas morindae]|uniref:Uncharacterized protein n=1 Tax=Sphingomonas morindae TaxID=1541170 RepID=A0ABY4XDX1_9SPHN|nr:hypothetical protein [Sphingomonas morindae]USI74916.1 hypothetical protein LHA26_17240 [Sphingomonas morindae]